jgi:hypothetical protein
MPGLRSSNCGNWSSGLQAYHFQNSKIGGLESFVVGWEGPVYPTLMAVGVRDEHVRAFMYVSWIGSVCAHLVENLALVF